MMVFRIYSIVMIITILLLLVLCVNRIASNMGLFAHTDTAELMLSIIFIAAYQWLGLFEGGRLRTLGVLNALIGVHHIALGNPQSLLLPSCSSRPK